jgi:hypothetical protein
MSIRSLSAHPRCDRLSNYVIALNVFGLSRPTCGFIYGRNETLRGDSCYWGKLVIKLWELSYEPIMEF